MKDLHHQHYSLVFCEKEEVIPWIVNKEKFGKIESIGKQLLENSAQVSKLNPDNFLDILSLFRQGKSQDTISLDEDTLLELIGLRSSGLIETPFMTKEQYNAHFRESDNILLTEKFQSSSSLNSGSGRHAIIGDLQFKGIGRNSLANQLDYSHSWGGMLPIDGLKSLLSDSFCRARCKIKALETIGVFLYKNRFSGIQQALCLREADSYRACMFWEDIINSDLRSTGRKHLDKVFNGAHINKIFELIVDNYVHAFSVGVLHRTPTVENISIDGRWIDTESIDFKIQKRPHNKYLNIFVPGEKIDNIKNLDELFKSKREARFMGSWVHDLKIPCLITYKVFKNIFEDEFSIDFNEVFNNTLKKYSLDDKIWEKVLKKYSCIKERGLSNESYGQLKNLECNDFYSIKEFNCIGNFYDYYYDGNLMLFSLDDDSSFESRSILEKWNLALTKNELSFDRSFKNFELLVRSIK